MELIYNIYSLFFVMNKIYVITIFILFLFSGLIYSIEMGNNVNKMNESLGQQNQEQLGNQTQNQEQAGELIQEKEMNKEQVKVMKKEGNKTEIEKNNKTANTEMNVIQEENKVHVQLSNGRNAEVKIMPDVASETAMERLRLKVCSEENNCTIELKETGQGNETKAMYEIKAEKKARLFGVLETKMQVKAQINAENGEIIREERPWWSFLAIEEEEE